MRKCHFYRIPVRLIPVIAAVIFALTIGCGGDKSRIYRVGVLSGLHFFAEITDGFKAQMAEIGYIEGGNITYDVRTADPDTGRYRDILRSFVADGVDLVLVFPTEASLEAKTVVSAAGIPVIFVAAFTEGTRLVDDIRHPPHCLTGVRWPGQDVALMRFEVMRGLVPGATRIWIPYMKDYPIVNSQLEVLSPVAEEAGISIVGIPATDAGDLSRELRERSRNGDGPGAILIIAEPLGVIPDAFKAMAEFASEKGIPVGGAMMMVDGYESVFGISPRSEPQGRQAALLADKVLKGIPAETLPVVSAEYYFRFNYRAARKLGLDPGKGLLSRADEIIK